MIVSVLNQKGGSGKTTLSINLARCLSKQVKNLLLVDSDPQGSARTWHEKSDGELLNLVALDRPTLSKDVVKLSESFDWIIIDGAPQVSSMTISAIKCSDVVLIPVQPSPYDIWASEDTVRFVKDYQENCTGKLKAAFVISRKISNTKIGREIVSDLEHFGLPIFTSGICQRIIYAESAKSGLTVFETDSQIAQSEITDISKELWRFAHGE